jgi:tetratricopeptide (TPR) repeat protein
MAFAYLSVHCAARAPGLTASDVDTLDRADALVRDGCYTCLRQASDIYSSLIEQSGRPSDRALRGAFGVALLLAVREKEIGLPAARSLTRARELLPLLETDAARSTASQQDFGLLLQAAEAVTGDLSGLDAEERQRRDDLRQSETAPVPTGTLPAALRERASTDLFAAYLAIAISCEQPRNPTSFDGAALSAHHGEPLLLRYRLAACSSVQPTSLTQLREGDPRWTDAFFFEGRYEMGSPARAAEPVRAAALLARAVEAFPDSVAIHLMLARALEMNGDFAAALASLDQVVARKPGHVDARLGRVRNLSSLNRTDDAIAAATELIAAGTWHVGDAYYWRAWNQYLARRLERAWADVQEAMRLLANTAVYALAGSIAYARKDLDTAVRHFDQALQMDATNCAAASSGGLVHVDLGAWELAADKYSTATNCFALAAKTARADLERIEQTTIEAPVKAARLSTARKRIESAEDLSGQSALSAAQSYIRANQDQLALRYIEVAERHPASRASALALRTRIAGVQ